jgi:hypothetical protein
MCVASVSCRRFYTRRAALRARRGGVGTRGAPRWETVCSCPWIRSRTGGGMCVREHGVDGFLWRYSYVRAWLAAHGRQLGRDPARHACSRGCEITVIQQPCRFRLGLLSHRSARLRSTTHATTPTPVSGRVVDLAPILCSPSSPAAACTTDDGGRPGRSRYCIPCIGHPLGSNPKLAVVD